MSDDFVRREANNVRDNSGNVYDIKGDHAEEEIPNPRDSTGVEPAAGYMGGGAGGVATSGFTTTADTESNELRSTSESGLHGSVAESADLGQRPLRDYKREGEPVFDTTDSTMSASQGSTGPVGSYVSDRDAVGSSSGNTGGSGTTIVDTSGDRLGDTSTTVRGESGSTMSERTGGVVAGGERIMRDDTSTSRDVGSGSISASTDNTGGLGEVSPTETLTNVREGMKVVDSTGDEIGKVRSLKSGDTSSATVDDAGDTGGDGGSIPIPVGVGTGGSSGTGSGGGVGAGAGLAGLFASEAGEGGEPNVPEPARSQLTRVGFIKIDSKGFFASDRYAGADQISRVDGDTVYLSVAKDDLVS